VIPENPALCLPAGRQGQGLLKIRMFRQPRRKAALVKLKNREHDFSSKLRQGSTVQRLRDYIQWQRDLEANISKALHRPRTKLTLHQILEKAKKVKEKNSRVSLGYSYVIVWEGLDIGGKTMSPNIQEMPRAPELAGKFSFDYIFLNPAL
jgi:hypothetical protein